MLLRLAQIIEQLDLALEQLQVDDPNYARFGLMLTDNALELTLHRLAEHEQAHAVSMRWKPDYAHPHAKKLSSALGQDFGAKVSLAQALGHLSEEEARTIRAGHTFRNETYHVGVRHEDVLLGVTRFYFKVACEVMGRLTPGYISWSSNDRLPERAKAYFPGDHAFPGSLEDYARACATLASRSDHAPADFIETLADHMERVIEDQDSNIDFLFTDGLDTTSRDQVIIDAQSWPIAFGDEGKAFVAGLPTPPANMFAAVEVVAQSFPGLVRKDPIPGWRRRVQDLAREANPHRALELYRSFMDQTQRLRAYIEESAIGLDNHIQSEIDRMRGN